MLCVTTPTIEGKSITSYQGIVAGEAVFGADFLRDALANLTDIVGGRSAQYERTFEKARTTALDQMRTKARALGADSIVGVALNYQVLGAANGMMMVAAVGTAVITGLHFDAPTAEAMTDELACYYVVLGAGEKGPFSRAQLREMLESGSLTAGGKCRVEDTESPITIAEAVKLA